MRNHDAGVLNVLLGQRLESAAQVLGEEGFCDGVEGGSVFRTREPVTLVGLENVGDRYVALFHSFHNLIRLRLCDPHVVRTLPNQQRLGDPIHVRKR